MNCNEWNEHTYMHNDTNVEQSFIGFDPIVTWSLSRITSVVRGGCAMMCRYTCRYGGMLTETFRSDGGPDLL